MYHIYWGRVALTVKSIISHSLEMLQEGEPSPLYIDTRVGGRTGGLSGGQAAGRLVGQAAGRPGTLDFIQPPA